MGYFGSKATSGLCQALIALMPPHSVYIESHLGGGALMKRKPTGVRSIGIDRDAQALEAFACDYPVELVHGCAHAFLASFPFLGPELVYSDPPYLHATRRSARRYRFDYEEVDHVALLDLLKDLPCQVMVSGHPSALYDEMLAGWRSLALQVTTQAQVRTEVVWFNFAPDRVHWASYAGRNFTDRQRIKRKAANWGRRYKALPAGERLAEVTEHRAHRCLCGACATVTGAVFPDGMTAPVQYGPRITAWVSYLLYAQFVPEKRLAELMSDLFAVSISTATITAMGRRTARRFEPFLAHVADVIRTAVPVKHLDETGLRIAARTRWLHVLCTPFLTVLRIGAGRGDVEKDLEGILIHDDYAAYFTLKGVRHGACNAHHLRELQALIDIEKEDWAKSMHRLLERAHRATRFSRENGRDVPASLVARISRAWARILDHAIAFHEAQPPLRTGKRGRKKRRIGHNLALRLRKHKEGCLRFLTDPRTPFTNNEAERDLRMAKLRQKISGGFRSERGAYNFARMRAVIATARKQGWNVLQTLVHPDPMQLIPQLRL